MQQFVMYISEVIVVIIHFGPVLPCMCTSYQCVKIQDAQILEIGSIYTEVFQNENRVRALRRVKVFCECVLAHSKSMVHVALGSFSDCMRGICILHNPEVNVFLEILDHIKKVVRLRFSLSVSASWPALLVPLHGHICTVLGNC